MNDKSTDSITRSATTRVNNGNFQIDASRATTAAGNYRVFTKQDVAFGNMRHRVRVGAAGDNISRSTWRDTPQAPGANENPRSQTRL